MDADYVTPSRDADVSEFESVIECTALVRLVHIGRCTTQVEVRLSLVCKKVVSCAMLCSLSCSPVVRLCLVSLNRLFASSHIPSATRTLPRNIPLCTVQAGVVM